MWKLWEIQQQQGDDQETALTKKDAFHISAHGKYSSPQVLSSLFLS